MKLIMTLVGIMVFTACESSNSNSPVRPQASFKLAAVNGIQFKSNRVQCHDPKTRQFRTASAITAGQESLTITGQKFSSQTISGGCEVRVEGDVRIDSPSEISFLNRKITYATNSECVMEIKLDEQSKPYLVVPISFKYKYKQGEMMPDFEKAMYVEDVANNEVGLMTLYKDMYSFDDVCFLVYSKK